MKDFGAAARSAMLQRLGHRRIGDIVGLRTQAMPQGLLVLPRMLPACSVVVVVVAAVVVVATTPAAFFSILLWSKNRQIGQ